MAIGTQGPLLELFEVREVKGRVLEASGRWVTGIANSLVEGSFSAVTALDLAMDAAGVPKRGESLLSAIPGTAAGRFSDLWCEERDVRSRGHNETSGEHLIEINCVFRDWPTTPRWVAGNSGLQQIVTEKLLDGTQAIVEYNGRQQGGELSVFNPTSGGEFEVVKAVDSPLDYVNDWVGTVNIDTVEAFTPGQLMVVDGDYDEVMADVPGHANRYRFTFRVEVNPQGWDPTAVYKSVATGEIPHDLVEGEGIKTFEYYRRQVLGGFIPSPTA